LFSSVLRLLLFLKLLPWRVRCQFAGDDNG
jgi:hypothetical protein